MAGFGSVLEVAALLHHTCRDVLSEASGNPLQGLRQALRPLSSQFSGRTRRCIRDLDTAYAFMRHITRAMNQQFTEQLRSELSCCPSCPASSCSTLLEAADTSVSSDSADMT
eukprot:9022694-Alexandrium_andersonii.AAC.1